MNSLLAKETFAGNGESGGPLVPDVQIGDGSMCKLRSHLRRASALASLLGSIEKDQDHDQLYTESDRCRLE